jgi:hypothetical protein
VIKISLHFPTMFLRPMARAVRAGVPRSCGRRHPALSSLAFNVKCFSASKSDSNIDGGGEDSDKPQKEWMKGTVFDEKLKKEKRAELRKVLQRGVGFVGDVRELNRTEGKLFVAGDGVIPFADAQRFPDIGEVKPLDPLLPQRNVMMSMKLNTTLVLVSFNSFGHEQVQQWTVAISTENPGIKVMEISASDNWGARLIETWLRSSLRKQIEEAYHASYFPMFSSKAIAKLCDGLGIENRMAPYVFLVDSHGLVRWKATGQPSVEEIESLYNCVETLVAGESADSGSGKSGRGRGRR